MKDEEPYLFLVESDPLVWEAFPWLKRRFARDCRNTVAPASKFVWSDPGSDPSRMQSGTRTPHRLVRKKPQHFTSTSDSIDFIFTRLSLLFSKFPFFGFHWVLLATKDRDPRRVFDRLWRLVSGEVLVSSVETVHPGRVQVALGPGQSPGVRWGPRTKRTKPLERLELILFSFSRSSWDEAEPKRRTQNLDSVTTVWRTKIKLMKSKSIVWWNFEITAVRNLSSQWKKRKKRNGIKRDEEKRSVRISGKIRIMVLVMWS